MKNFVQFLVTIRHKFKDVICIAHNRSGFDFQFILKEIVKQTHFEPSLIMRGTKILHLKVANVQFLDSFLYFPMSLSSLLKTFNLCINLKKGYFPHFFNKAENQDYIGKYPEKEFFGGDTMKEEEYKKFLEWYDHSKNQIFDIKKEIIEYCKKDVEILALSCTKFRAMFLRECNVEPFMEAKTIASACNLVYRRNFLKPGQIGLIPMNGYRRRDNQSEIALHWLLYEEKKRNISIKSAINGKEVSIKGVKVDGYSENTKEIFMFHGCRYHGCECQKQDRDKPLYSGSIETLNSRKVATEVGIKRLRGFGFIVNEMIECEFRNIVKSDREAKAIANNSLLKVGKLEPRDCFYGEEQKISKIIMRARGKKKFYTTMFVVFILM